jgi:protein-S-isoprenylcysteine O-methyltransferase Ste14
MPEKAREFAARLFVGVLNAQLAVYLFADFLRTGHLTAVLLMLSEALVVFFTIFRRPAQVVDRSLPARLVTAGALIGPALLRPSEVGGLLPDMVTALVLGAGVCVVKMTLGRSFGIAPANRGVVATGPYSIVRHPIYAGYLVTHAAFLVAHPTLRNLVVLLIADGSQIARTWFEERTLSNDAQYRQYCERVNWRLLPGVY